MAEPTDDESGQVLPKPVTLDMFLEQLQAEMPKMFGLLTHLGRERVIQSEADIRRGVVAVNGAGLLAVISLLSQSLHAPTVRIAALVYLLGLVSGWVGWWQLWISSKSTATAEMTFMTALVKLRTDPLAQKPMTTAAEVDAAQNALHRFIDKFAETYKKPGRTAPLWTCLALGCFLLATVALVADFELGTMLSTAPPAKLAGRIKLPPAAPATPAATSANPIKPPAVAPAVPPRNPQARSSRFRQLDGLHGD